MSKSTFISVLIVVGLVAGCAGSPTLSAAPGTQSSPTPSPTLQQPACLARSAARHEALGPSPALDVYAIGRSRDVVIASNQSDEDLCAWVPFATSLASHHVEVLLYDYTFGDAVSLLTRVVRSAWRDGARTVSLVGASEGAKASIVVAGRHPRAVTAVASLSAEASLGGIDVSTYARRLLVPVLYLSARHDPYGAMQAARRFEQVTPAREMSLRIVPGEDHGTALLDHPAIAGEVLRFLRTHER